MDEFPSLDPECRASVKARGSFTLRYDTVRLGYL